MSDTPLCLFLPDGSTLPGAEPEGVKNLYPPGTVMAYLDDWFNYSSSYRIKNSAINWQYSGMGRIGEILKPEHKAVLLLMGYDLYTDPFAAIYEAVDQAILEQAKCQHTT